MLSTLARLENISISDDDIPAGSVQLVLGDTTLVLPLADAIDINVEKARLQREIAKIEAEIAKFDQKLANKNFTDKAPAEVVEEQRTRRTEAENACKKLNEALVRLGK